MKKTILTGWLEDFKYSGTNITAFRLVNPDLHEVQKARKLLQSQESTYLIIHIIHIFLLIQPFINGFKGYEDCILSSSIFYLS